MSQVVHRAPGHFLVSVEETTRPWFSINCPAKLCRCGTKGNKKSDYFSLLDGTFVFVFIINSI